ncbi:hypothetical protein [Pseudomonas syringae]|uniref:Sporulation protein n=1 Tax=Pseudomonas syringae TaxID=317 RepID=A0A085VPM8_PSESX|nr:hypothetical protein [Pseudomonas syringae]KFE57391.1 hypothetical protein IV01_04730 [Pseudomonas syringae]
MRWLFLLLLMLNGFYYVWHQQEAPLRAKEVLPLSLHRAEQQNIRLLTESDGSEEQGRDARSEETCLYLGGFMREREALVVAQRLTSLDVHSELQTVSQPAGTGYWLKIEPASRRLVGESLVDSLVQDFPQLKNKIMLCSGIATSE